MKKTKLQDLIKSMTYGVIPYDDYCRVHEVFYDLLKDAPEFISWSTLKTIYGPFKAEDKHTDSLIENIIFSLSYIYSAIELPR